MIKRHVQLNWVQSQLKPGILAFIFSVHCRLEMHQANPTLVSEISRLQSVFPHSLFLESQRALAFYRMKGSGPRAFSLILDHDFPQATEVIV